jgi:hypothetical protein
MPDAAFCPARPRAEAANTGAMRGFSRL